MATAVPPGGRLEPKARFRRALIVEDDDRLRRSIARLASDWSKETLQAATAAEGRRMLEQEPDLVVIDVRLPDESGLTVAQAARQRQPRPAMIAVSGMASASEAFGMARHGVHVFLSKPFSADEFREKVRFLLNSMRPLAETAQLQEAGAPYGDGAIGSQLVDFAQQYRLSPREVTVVRLALSGLPRSRFPAILGVSDNTCKTLVRRVLHKCEARHLADIPRMLLVRDPP